MKTVDELLRETAERWKERCQREGRDPGVEVLIPGPVPEDAGEGKFGRKP